MNNDKLNTLPLKQIIYASALSDEPSPECIAHILAISQANNQALAITGILLFAGGSFLEVLEGEVEQVDALYERITRDPRHKHILKLLEQEIETRQFPNWIMGHAEIPDEDLQAIEGMEHFSSVGRHVTKLKNGITRQILVRFREGLWRQADN